MNDNTAPRSWATEVQESHGAEWHTPLTRFDTSEEATEYGGHLLTTYGWTMGEARVTPSNDPVNSRWENGLIAVDGPHESAEQAATAFGAI